MLLLKIYYYNRQSYTVLGSWLQTISNYILSDMSSQAKQNSFNNDDIQVMHHNDLTLSISTNKNIFTSLIWCYMNSVSLSWMFISHYFHFSIIVCCHLIFVFVICDKMLCFFHSKYSSIFINIKSNVSNSLPAKLFSFLIISVLYSSHVRQNISSSYDEWLNLYFLNLFFNNNCSWCIANDAIYENTILNRRVLLARFRSTFSWKQSMCLQKDSKTPFGHIAHLNLFFFSLIIYKRMQIG